MDLFNLYKNYKPELSDSSIHNYINNIERLVNNNYRSLDKFEDIIDDINELPVSDLTKRNYVSSVITYLKMVDSPSLPLYSAYYDQITKEYMKGSNNQVKTEKEKNNWVELKQLRYILKRKYTKLNKAGVFDKDKLNNEEYKQLLFYVLGNLYIGSDKHPPLRNDYIMRVINKNEYDRDDKGNYLVLDGDDMFYHIGKYKTDKIYGIKQIKICKKIKKLLHLWLKHNTSGFLLTTTTRAILSKNNLTKYLNKTFEETGKNISSTMLRHIYLSDRFPADLNKRNKTADLMCHSVSQGMNYAKK